MGLRKKAKETEEDWKRIVTEYAAWMDAHPEKEYGIDSLGEFFSQREPQST